MAGDLEASKNGGKTVYTPITIEPIRDPIPPRPENIKPSFPKIDLPAPKPNEEKTPPDHNWPPVPKTNPPFNTPISQPITPPQRQPQSFSQSGAPLNLPTNNPPFRPSPAAPRPLTPPPIPTFPPVPPRNMPPLNQTRPPLPPLPRPIPPAVLPPLPTPPKSAPVLPRSENGSKKKLIFMAVLGTVILTFIIGEIWWFFLREEPSAVTTQELLPPPQELQPLLPPEEIAPVMELSELAAADLLSYDRVQTLALADLTALSGDVIASGELVKIKIADEFVTETTALPLDNIIESLKIKITAAVAQNLAEELEIFVFGGNTFDQNECARAKNTSPNCWGPRLGLVMKVADPVKISAALRAWEKTMSADLKPLVLAKTGLAATPTFQTGLYQSQTIRYKNLPINTITVEYALIDNVLIITTSKSAMLKAIDVLKISDSEESILYEGE